MEMDAEKIADLVRSCGFIVAERYILPGRQASYQPVPGALHMMLREHLARLYPHGLYTHQSLGIEQSLRGSDVCLATPTASGKSLTFMSVAVHQTLMDRFAKVLAFYPVKALLQDQLGKWEEFLKPFGVRVGFIDGSVGVEARARILDTCRIVAMTPDVAHAWMMSHLTDKNVSAFLQKLKLLVLDEAHVYDGVFGTNMAYLLRRMAVAAAPHRLICSTATVGEPEAFLQQLTGRQMVVLDADDDGSAGPEKTILLAQTGSKKAFQQAVQLLVNLVGHEGTRFLAFSDSRKAVERIVAATLRHGKDEPESEGSEPEEEDFKQETSKLELILPYRAGYEEEDRQEIQRALSTGMLAGVVSTSALELGLDIGDIDIVVLMNTPPTTKSFYQRLGRAGRRRQAVCIVIDEQRRMSPLGHYMQRAPEPSWMYLENRYIQYANALCAASELQALGITSAQKAEYAGLPESFRRFVENELNPTQGVDADLFALKQQGQGNPQYEFPIRNATEQNFTAKGPFDKKIGTLSYPQVLREAYPGAVYYYMAHPWRVFRVDYKKREVLAKGERYITTQPTTQTMVFADFKGGLHQVLRSSEGFLAEADLQVSERVTGFVEVRGKNKHPHEYGVSSQYSQKPLNRFFRTTGICWAFPGKANARLDVANRILDAFCFTCGIQERDVGFGLFRSSQGPFEAAPIQGCVIYDATYGSLRLTQRLLERLDEVLLMAIEGGDDEPATGELEKLRALVSALQPVTPTATTESPVSDGDWASVVRPGERAMLMQIADGPTQVKVLAYRYTPQGLIYELEHDKPAKWYVHASTLQPIHGETRMLRVNLMTGEEMSTDL